MNLKGNHRQVRKKENGIIRIIVVCVLVLAIGIVNMFSLGSKTNTDKRSDATEKNQSFETEKNQSFEIETKYCSLYYPKSWQKQIEVKYSEEAGYKVEFYGNIDGKEVQHLFDVCFNSDDGDLLGYFDKDEQVINVSLHMLPLEFGEDWTQEEIDQIYAMQEEANFVIEMLEVEEGYVNP